MSRLSLETLRNFTPHVFFIDAISMRFIDDGDDDGARERDKGMRNRNIMQDPAQQNNEETPKQ
jgi:hypothetical protein